MEVLGIAANVIAVVDLSAKVGVLCGEYIRSAWNASDDVRKLKTETESLQRILGDIRSLLGGSGSSDSLRHQLATSQRLLDHLLECQKELGKLVAKLDTGKNPSRLKRFGKALKWPFSSKEVVQAIESLRRWRELFSTAMQVDQLNIALRLDENIDLANLVAAKGAAFDDYDNEPGPRCHPETRQDLLRQVYTWVDDPDGKCIFWLCGPAGTGKSTISRTVASAFAGRNQLAASFFFNRTRNGCNKADLFVTTVARQLLRRVPLIRNPITQAIQADPDLPEKGLQVQFDRLVLEPMSKIKVENLVLPTLVLVIDALDECDSGNLDGHNSVQSDRTRQLVGLLAKTAAIEGIRVRVFLTSRPELPIQMGFKNDVPEHSHRDVALLRDIPQTVIEHDIRIFINAQLTSIRNTYNIPEDWPGEDAVDKLVSITMPLFIYASTMCRFINDPRQRFDPRSQLQKIMAGSQGKLANIRGTYQPILEQLLIGLSDDEGEQVLQDFRRVVGSIILLADPLPIFPLSQLLGVREDEVHYQLNNLHSVLDIPAGNEPDQPVKLFHLSFREYLLSDARHASPFSVEERSKHGDLLRCCLGAMSNGPCSLKNDICQLGEPGVLRADVETGVIRSHIPQHLQYACLYWAHHLEGSRKLIEDGDEIDSFLNRYFVHWLEAMSWMGKMKESVEIVLQLQHCVALPDSKAAAFLQDARRFVLKHRHVVDMAPCQIYSSAILFSPEKSVIRTTFFSEVPTWIAKYPEVADGWDPAIHVMKANGGLPVPRSTAPHPEGITPITVRRGNVTFSPDGQTLATARKGRIILWNTNTGNVLRVLDRQDCSFSCISFASDVQIAAGTNLGVILLWDFFQDTLDPDIASITDFSPQMVLAWSPDGVYLITGGRDECLGIWRQVPGSARMAMVRSIALGCTTNQYSYRSPIMCFSPCGRFFASSTEVSTSANPLDGNITACSDTLIWDFPSLLNDSFTLSYIRVDKGAASQIMGFTPSGTHLAIFEGAIPATISMVHSASGIVAWELRIADISEVSDVLALAFNSIGTRLVTIHKSMVGAHGTTMSLVDASRGFLLWKVPMANDIFSSPTVSFDRSDQFLMVQRSKLFVHDVATGARIESHPSLLPCNVAFERDDGVWVTKRGRRMLHLPAHCQRHVGVREWASHPHRYVGYDNDRERPFFIHFSCDGCTV
ncbi:hypothetical protein LZ30DRAFT_612447 [Colletotrichum cereale]|nr:hypothetical protein LZ30DRAFT_612447 [Colletotrichum cereale]